MKFDLLQWGEKIPYQGLRHRILDVMLSFGIPFNRWLRYHIAELSEKQVKIVSPDVVLRRNHVGGAHACALALMGEYPAGLLIAKRFPMETYRFIIGNLNIDYHKQGRGELTAIANAPATWPELQEGEAWIEMLTAITNSKGEAVATCRTKWHVKEWARTKFKG